MSENAVEQIAELREELDVDAQRFERARDRMGAVSANDATGAVTVRTDTNGLVESVSVEGGWRDRLGADWLAEAVMEAYGNTMAIRSQAWAEEFAEETPLRPRPAPALHTTTAGQLRERIEQLGTQPDAFALMERLLALLEDIDGRFDDSLARTDRLAAQEYVGRSSSRHVRARVAVSGMLMGVEYDDRWLPTAHAFNIGRETLEAIHDALRDLAEAQSADQDPLAELARLADDPDALAEFLGLAG